MEYQDQNEVSEQTSAQRQLASTFTTTYIIYIQDYETMLYVTIKSEEKVKLVY